MAEIKFRDPVVERVVRKFINRSDTGYEKYGRTLNEERTQGFKDLSGYLNDVQEELMDAVLYIQAAREEIQDHLEEFAIHATADNGDGYDTCSDNYADYDPSDEF